jgi:hypothetical protein
MSRIILAVHPDDQDRFVVGWDHIPCGAYWQEMDRNDEVVRLSGAAYTTIPGLVDAVPVEYRPLITGAVCSLLRLHADDPDSGHEFVNLAPAP